MFSREFIDLDMRLEAMDRQGFDVQALSLATPMVYFAPGPIAPALSQAFNDAASAAHRQHSTRFVGMAMLPVHALEELERASTLPGMRGVYMGTPVLDMGHEQPFNIVERWTGVATSDRDLIPGGNAARMLKI